MSVPASTVPLIVPNALIRASLRNPAPTCFQVRPRSVERYTEYSVAAHARSQVTLKATSTRTARTTVEFQHALHRIETPMPLS